MSLKRLRAMQTIENINATKFEFISIGLILNFPLSTDIRHVNHSKE